LESVQTEAKAENEIKSALLMTDCEFYRLLTFQPGQLKCIRAGSVQLIRANSCRSDLPAVRQTGTKESLAGGVTFGECNFGFDKSLAQVGIHSDRHRAERW